MKYLIIALLIFPFPSFAQQDTLLSYQEVVPVPGKSQSDLFICARAWFNKTFVSSKEVLQISDKEAGELSGKGISYLTPPFKALGTVYNADVELSYMFSVWVKDGKFKYHVTQLAAKDRKVGGYDYGPLTSANEMPIKLAMISKKKADQYWLDIKKSAAAKIEILTSSLKNEMLNKANATNEW